jgi:hypothetical protein
MQRRHFLAATSTLIVVGAETRTRIARAEPPESNCDKVHAIDIPDGTTFPHSVSFQIGRSDLARGDRIVIEEVLGTRRTFEVGGIYLVRGTCSLGSEDTATLNANVTATARGEGCTSGNPRGRKAVRSGNGELRARHADPIRGLAARLAGERRTVEDGRVLRGRRLPPRVGTARPSRGERPASGR